MDDRLYWLGFSNFSGIGPGRLIKLLDFFGDAETAWKASSIDLQQVGLPEKLIEEFISFRTTFHPTQYASQLLKQHVSYVTWLDPEFPELLRQSKNAPFVLYVKGDKKILRPFDKLRAEQDIYIAVVGTRKITDYGRQVTELLVEDLVQAGCIIVSGLALGVDAVAHKATIKNGGKTIAVLGCGVDCCYPRENETIYNSIIEHGGAIVSEYPLSMQPSVGSFPSRNRIIAGLSQGVIVTEGAAKSGSLITAKDAFKNGRHVFAVPGPITSALSQGPSLLIKQGATLVSTAGEILEKFGIVTTGQRFKDTEKPKGDTAEEQKIIDLLHNQQVHFDELVRQTIIDSSSLGGILSLMEMKGMITRLDAGFFCLNVHSMGELDP